MKKNIFLVFILFSFKIFSQELSDRIFPKEGDSIVCKITSIEKNWIYYDYQGKKSIKNDFTHINDIKYYLYNGEKISKSDHKEKYDIIPITITAAKNISEEIKIIDSSLKDTIKTFYLDNTNKKQKCLILLNRNQKIRQSNKYNKLELIDSLGNITSLLHNQISGYWINEVFYKKFKIIYDNKNIIFYAEEPIKDKVSLYLYNGEQLNLEPIYIFKKQMEAEYHFVQEKITKKQLVATSNTIQGSDGSVSNLEILAFYDKTPYLNYFQLYFSDCSEIKLKFKSNWYTYEDITTAFSDYNNCR